jgi:hypothetical protein
MDGSIENWKAHVKKNGSVYSVQYTINGVSELPGNEGFKRGARRPVVKIVYYNRPPYRLWELCFTTGPPYYYLIEKMRYNSHWTTRA